MSAGVFKISSNGFKLSEPIIVINIAEPNPIINAEATDFFSNSSFLEPKLLGSHSFCNDRT